MGHKQGKYRNILLLNQARAPLYEYLQTVKRVRRSAYVFPSQRETLLNKKGELDGWCLDEAAIPEWFKNVKRTATKEGAGLDDGELAVYLGHITKHGTSAIQTTARYTQPSLEEIKDKL